MLTPDVSANLIDQLKARARVQSHIPSVSPVKPGVLTLGSDCSGMGMDYLSLKFLKLPVPVDIAFCSEVDDSKRSILNVMHEGSKVGVMYGDITARDNTAAPPVDIFVSGAPCQAFSAAGKSNGVLESRGLVILHSLAYVVEQLPPVVVFENVAGLLRKKHSPVLKSMSKVLARLKYTVSYKLLNTKHHGIPQNRPRVYLIGIRNGSGIPFEWPDQVLPAAATDFLELDVRGDAPDQHLPLQHLPLQHMSATAKRNVRTSKKLFAKRWGRKLREAGTTRVADNPRGLRACPTHAHHTCRKLPCQVDWSMHTIFVDAQAGAGFRSAKDMEVPCITKSRGGSNGFYVISLSRFMTIYEIGAFQGVPSWVIDRLLRRGITKVHLGRALGDAMSLNVLMRVIPRALRAGGLLPNWVASDVWARTSSLHGQRLPDAVLKG